MKINSYSIVRLYYTLTNNTTNEIIQSVPADAPAEFVFGNGELLDHFESNLIGKSEGEKFSFTILPEHAYGPVDPTAIFDLPISTFANEDGSFDEGVLMPGNVFPMEDNDGNKHFGKLIKIMEESVTMDFNHPLAGKTLRFEGEITEVKSYSKNPDKELTQHL